MGKRLLGSSRLSKGNQITLPKEARDILNVKPGDVIAIYVEEDEKTISLFIL
ncbi:MAG: AbrB/MazE/SpoVT family DNA-binding domain-containing protein [Candidatus Hermodarchaeota archaeon]